MSWSIIADARRDWPNVNVAIVSWFLTMPHDRHRETRRHTTDDRDALLDELRRDKAYLQGLLDRTMAQLAAERERADVLQLRAIRHRVGCWPGCGDCGAASRWVLAVVAKEITMIAINHLHRHDIPITRTIRSASSRGGRVTGDPACHRG